MNSPELAATQVPLRRIGDRYAIDDVDDFLARCASALRSGEQGHHPELRVEDLVVKQFRSVQFGKGYDADAVDDLLDEVAVRLRTYAPPLEMSPEAEAISTQELKRAVTRYRALVALCLVAVAGGVVMMVMTALGKA